MPRKIALIESLIAQEEGYQAQLEDELDEEGHLMTGEELSASQRHWEFSRDRLAGLELELLEAGLAEG